MSYKILNLSTGRYFDGSFSDIEYNFTPIIYDTLEEAQQFIRLITFTSSILKSNAKIRPEHLEIIEVIDE
jgi:hypothetical protein